MSIKHITDSAILAAVDRGDGCGGRSYNVAQRLNLTPEAAAAITRRLKRLESRGLVEQCPRHSAVNSIFWRTKGRLQFPLEQLDEATRSLIGGRPVRIWSGQWGGWWKPEGHGYTTKHEEAWVLSASAAYREVSHCGPEKQIFLVDVRP